MDMEPLEDVYQQYADQVKRFLVCLTGDLALAEELTQETFFRAVRSAGQFREGSDLRAWLYTIARNLCVDVTRQRETLPLQETDQVAADPAGTLVERWDLERALETLTPQDQELLLLRYANQVPLQALSRLTGLSRFAIYRRCGRLLTQLREALREEERT